MDTQFVNYPFWVFDANAKIDLRDATGTINLSSPVKRLFKSSYTKKPQRAQRTQRNINSVISESSVVDYPYHILFLLISSKIPHKKS